MMSILLCVMFVMWSYHKRFCIYRGIMRDYAGFRTVTACSRIILGSAEICHTCKLSQLCLLLLTSTDFFFKVKAFTLFGIWESNKLFPC